ncbi:MAG: AAA family ATPase [Candidatus Staskawiczbacteria bacterium]|nr:AAA family ATPase [Candidatus Staskawiczbacteria bacterium]
MANKIVFIVGMTGSGKSEVSDELIKNGFAYLRFGQLTLDIMKEKGLEVNEVNEKATREGLRKEHGMGAYATLNIPKFDELLKTSNVVGDGLYSWTEYKILKEKYGDLMYVLAVYAPPKIRYERLAGRKTTETDKDKRFRPLTEEEAKKRDYAEIENIEKGGPIAMADFTIQNTGTMEDLKNNVKKVIELIQ